MSVTELHPAPTKLFKPGALTAEQGRRKNNKRERKVAAAEGREPNTAKAASFIFPNMSNDDLVAVLAGATVQVDFKSGRTEHVAVEF